MIKLLRYGLLVKGAQYKEASNLQLHVMRAL